MDDLKDVRNILALTTSGKVPHLEADPLEMYAFELRPYALYKNKYQKKKNTNKKGHPEIFSVINIFNGLFHYILNGGLALDKVFVCGEEKGQAGPQRGALPPSTCGA